MRAARPGDLIDIVRRLQRQVRQLRLQKRCHTESKNFIVEGDVDASRVIPSIYLAVDPPAPDEMTPPPA